MFTFFPPLFVHSRGSAVKFLGTKRHHDKWLLDTENYVIKGCFAMTELGHGSNVSGENVFSGMCNYISSTDEVSLLLFCWQT
jgi:alkylation response protein AidB-like acyl-CoA dehydrogenase